MRNPPPRSISTWRLLEPVIVDCMYPKNIHGLWKKIGVIPAWFWRGGEQRSTQFDGHFYISHSESTPKHRTWKRLVSLLKQTAVLSISQDMISNVRLQGMNFCCETSSLIKRLECLNRACVTIKDNIRNYTTWNSQIVEYPLKVTKEHFQKILFKKVNRHIEVLDAFSMSGHTGVAFSVSLKSLSPES